MQRKKIGTIEQELARCRAAFRRHPRAVLYWCCHHNQLIENAIHRVDFDWKGRIKYILKEKDPGEHAVRFRNFRPVKNKKLNRTWASYRAGCKKRNRYLDTYYKAIDILDSLTKADFDREWPNNTWSHNYSSIWGLQDGSIFRKGMP